MGRNHKQASGGKRINDNCVGRKMINFNCKNRNANYRRYTYFAHYIGKD